MTWPGPSATRFVMFGTHPLFGDYVDAIHAAGGVLARVVRNVAEPDRPAGQRFEDRVAAYERWCAGQGYPHRVAIEWLDDYTPQADEQPVAGFRGPKLEGLITILHQRHGLRFPPLVHPSATVSPMARLEEGVFVGAATVVGPNARIGRFCYLNRGVSIGHDTVLDDHVIVGPSVAVASGVRCREGAILGIGATIIEQLTIGIESYVAAGAVVLKDVGDHRLVAGVPAVDKKAFHRPGRGG